MRKHGSGQENLPFLICPTPWPTKKQSPSHARVVVVVAMRGMQQCWVWTKHKQITSTVHVWACCGKIDLQSLSFSARSSIQRMWNALTTTLDIVKVCLPVQLDGWNSTMQFEVYMYLRSFAMAWRRGKSGIKVSVGTILWYIVPQNSSHTDFDSGLFPLRQVSMYTGV